MIIGIILAAGTSSRFNSDIAKQLYFINNKPIIEYSIDNMIQLVDRIIIVKNKNIILPFIITSKMVILENNINQRKESVNVAIKYIKDNFINIEKVIIHDAARPFITQSYFEQLLKNNSKYNIKRVTAPKNPDSSHSTEKIKSVRLSGKKSNLFCVPFPNPFPYKFPEPIAIFDCSI